MALATWWLGDPFPKAVPIPGFQVSNQIDDAEMAVLNGLDLSEVQARRRAGHLPYAGFMDGLPVTYGWVATRSASIGELGLEFPIPTRDRYLWDFATRPEWQGRGLYPRLLAAIIASELMTAQRFWIIHAPENLPSGAGIGRAGFVTVGELSFTAGGSVGLQPEGNRERARAGAALLGVPLREETLTPCWRCGPPSAGTDHTRGDGAGDAASCACHNSGSCNCGQPLRSSRPAPITLLLPSAAWVPAVQAERNPIR